MRLAITPAVINGKKLWETRNCIGCHTLLEKAPTSRPSWATCTSALGGYFIKAWIKAQPTNAPGRRQMPQFNFTEAQLDDLVEFLALDQRGQHREVATQY